MYLAEMYRPDFRTINDFRKNHLSLIEGYFVEIVKMCKELGMVKVGELTIDGSKLKANAAPRRSKDKEGYEAWLKRVEEEVREILREAGRVDAEEDALYGEQRGDELPGGIQGKMVIKKKIEEVLRGGRGSEREDQPHGSGQSVYEREKRGDCPCVQLSGSGGGASDRGSGCGEGGERSAAVGPHD
jgi:hypothetical protein